MLHIVLHFLVPAIVAGIFYRKEWQKVFLILIATMLVDMDHLLADPIYDPDRCSIGFHPLHSYVAVGVYFIMLIFPKTRIIGLGLVIHMVLDFIDCYT
ncbi:MAG: DUF6122 family protein [Bacteroidota bacterium]|nr:DUF6122 family protein [Bacteroidota bacterium]